MRTFKIALAAACVILGSAASADDGPVVVELYTSQGCSSCPPADALLEKLAQRDDVLPLALHVDYWDYIGWKDIFANPAYTARQKRYAHVAGQRAVYTPQMVVGGRDHVVGTHPMDVADLVAKHAGHDSGVRITASRSGGTLEIAVSAEKPVGEAVVQLVRYMPSREVAIRRGENAGRTLDYHNIVSDWRSLRDWSGQTDARFAVSGVGDGPLAVIVQKAGQGPVLAAARLR